MVECGGLENRCPAIAGPGVRTPLSPQRQITPAASCGIFVFQMNEPGSPERGKMKNKNARRVKRAWSNLSLQEPQKGSRPSVTRPQPLLNQFVLIPTVTYSSPPLPFAPSPPLLLCLCAVKNYPIPYTIPGPII